MISDRCASDASSWTVPQCGKNFFIGQSCVQTQPLTFLIPKILTFFQHVNVHVRIYSVGCINHFVPLLPDALKA